jgi:hypothetical protein
MASNQSTYSYRINDYSSPSGWTTTSLFDVSYVETNASAIDTFYAKIRELNVLILDPRNFRVLFETMHTDGKISSGVHTDLTQAITDTQSIQPVFSNLVLLGYISAVESFIREILRKIISLDVDARRACELKTIAYGATLFHTPEMLPEALLENMTFISKDNIEKVLKEFVGISKIPIPRNISDILVEYENVCQLRHCIVHRFGKLGANNAIKLGLDSHGSFIEKPIKLTYIALQRVAAVCSNLVKEVNQFLWEYIMMRLIAEPTGQTSWKKRTDVTNWTWDYRKDKRKFKVYFDTFAFTTSSTNVADMTTAYQEYKAKYRVLA